MTAALPSVILDTARLRLRAHRDDDLAELVSLAGVWEVASWLIKLPHPYTDDHGRDWIAHVRQAHAAGSPRMFAIALKETDQLIGGVGLDGISGDNSEEPSLGYWLGPPYWARGYAREAVSAVIGYGFRKLRFETIRAITDPDNVASQKVLLACGLRKIADIDLVEPMRRGARHAPLFRATRHDYPAAWEA
jgi:RimJ/RimL family protein N-acetyltransferase